jgi:hypothetical protein
MFPSQEFQILLMIGVILLSTTGWKTLMETTLTPMRMTKVRSMEAYHLMGGLAVREVAALHADLGSRAPALSVSSIMSGTSMQHAQLATDVPGSEGLRQFGGGEGQAGEPTLLQP